MKGSSHEILAVPDSEGDWDSIRDVQPYGCNTIQPEAHQLPAKVEKVHCIPGCRSKRNAAPQAWETQDER